MSDGSVAQLVEQRPEEPRVTGSSPVGTTILWRHTESGAAWEKSPISRGFFFIYAPIPVMSLWVEAHFLLIFIESEY